MSKKPAAVARADASSQIKIDETARVHPSAIIGKNVEIGPYSIIGPQVTIGDDTKIGPHVVIHSHTIIGKHNQIFQFASLGSDPQHLNYRGEETWLVMGDYNVVREYVTINRGTREGSSDGYTRVGHHNYLMSCSHIAHDCVIGDHIIFANMAAIAGFVRVGSHAILGAYAGVHQYVNIGAFSFLGRATKIYNDILPYMLVTGNPGAPNALNAVGLKRNGFSDTALRGLKQAFAIIFKRGLKQAEIITQLTALAAEIQEVDVLLQAIVSSKRGIARHGSNEKDNAE